MKMSILRIIPPVLNPGIRWVSQTSSAATKSSLSILRKKTGLAFSLCKTALEMHNNDVKKAEQWLKAEAQRRGWEKAAKVQGRATSQGLVAIHAKSNMAAMIEVNCETDFVARNPQFKELVSQVALHCHNYTASKQLEQLVQKWHLSAADLSSLPWENGKSISDLVAVFIGKLGENMVVNKAVCVKAQDGVTLSVSTHPGSDHFHGSLLGRYGAIVAFRKNPNSTASSTPKQMLEFGRQLCQHVVGMNPSSIGSLDDKPAEDLETEERMIHQEFIFDPEVTVKDVLAQYDVEVLDFVRFECGEVANTANEEGESSSDKPVTEASTEAVKLDVDNKVTEAKI